MKSYVIRAINPVTGAYVYSRTNNVNQRIETLKYNIQSINGQGTAVFDRFIPFIGITPNDAVFEVYKQVDKAAV